MCGWVGLTLLHNQAYTDKAITTKRVVDLAGAGSNGSKDVRALLEGAVDNVGAEAVEHAHGPEKRVGKGGGNNGSEGEDELTQDYGVPIGPYYESAHFVYTRKWTGATVTMDCNTFTPSLVPK